MARNRVREVVLVGGGHAHIQLLASLAEDPPPNSRFTVIVDRPIAVYSGMVPGFVAGQYRAEDVELDVVYWSGRAGAQVKLTRAVGVDPETRRIAVEEGPPVPYDVASFDIGSTVAALDLPGIREHALPTRPIAVFNRCIAEIVSDAAQRDPDTPLRVVVVGGGAAGIEVAFTLEQRLKQAARAPVEVLVLEAGPRILSAYPKSLVRRVYRGALKRGIQLRCGQEVAAAEGGAVRLDDGERIPCDTLIWVTGPVSHPIFSDSGLPTDDRGFVRVRSTLQFEEQDNLFAAGDCATLIDYPKTPKAGVYAVREGPVITANVRAFLAEKALTSYRPQGDFLTLMNLGDGTALGSKWGLSVGGRWVMKLKDRIDRRFMGRFQHPDDGRSG